jgi:hypothetical protein
MSHLQREQSQSSQVLEDVNYNKLERTRLRCAGDAVDLGLHLALAKVGDDATCVIVDKYICSLFKGHSFHKRIDFYNWNLYLEIAVQDTLLVEVRHTIRDLVYHFQRVDTCGISAA